MPQTKTPLLTRGWALALGALVCCMLWGSAFPGVKIGYRLLAIDSADWAGQMVFAGTRFAIAGGMVIALGSVTARHFLYPKRHAIPKVAVLSMFQTVLQYFFYYIGLAHTTGVKAAVIVAANVFFAILLSSCVFRLERMTVNKLAGCLIGFLGVVTVHLGALGGPLNLLGDGFILLCTAASGFSSVFMKRYSAAESPMMLSGWQFLAGGAVMALFGLLCGGRLPHLTPAGWGILVYLAFVSAAAYTLWSMLLKFHPVSRVTVFGFLNPVCGVLLSALLLHEPGAFSLRTVCALVLVSAGIILVNRTGGRPAQG
ncbi:MAG: DMT family transporter [Oscillospiraceae bacterium]|nr:DMT family transporter [Oscillospiraceae bacterium]